MGMKSYGRIAITNINKVGTLSVNPTCNMPLQVIYNPDDSSYIPDWSKTNLEVKPIVYFDGTLLNSDYTVTFKKKDGSSDPVTITATSGVEAVKNNVLTVSNNVLEDSNSGIITYLMDVSYTEPKTKVTLNSVASLSFSLIKNSETVKYANISGENVFLYNSKQQIQGSNSLTLEGTVTGVTISAWKYRNSNGEWTDYPTTHNESISGNSLVVYESDSVFINDKAVIKLVTSDSSIYDIITVTKIRDGAAGGNSISCVLSNESHVVPADSDGTAITLNGAETQVFIYEGGLDVTADWDISYSVSDPSKMSVQYNSSDGKYIVASMDPSLDCGYVTFTCTKSDGTTAPLTAKFTVTKIKAGLNGENAVMYYIRPNTVAINKTEAGVFTPGKAIFQAKKRVGNSNETNYSGRFVIFESTVTNPTDSDWIEKVKSTTDETYKQYTPSSTTRAIKCLLLPAGSTSTDESDALDYQTVIVSYDGDKGADGATGEGGLSVILGNEAEIITCDTGALVSQDQTITIPYTVYKGLTKVAGSATISGSLPSGMTLIGTTNASESAAGVVTLKAAKGANLGGTSVMKGEINILITVDSVQETKKFVWSKSVRAKDGSNAIILQSYAPNGNVIINKTNSVTIATMLVDGSTIVESGVTYVWYRFDGSDYAVISGQTSSTLTVTPDMVDSMASFKCTATYNSYTYDTYYVVTDRSDPYEVVPYSSIGTQLVNNDKPGAIFTRVMQNGSEVDPLKTNIFSTTAPSSPSSGDFYYHLDNSAKTCTLMKYNGSTWEAASGSDLPKLNYKYFKLDSTGNAIDITTPWKTGKAIYFDNTDSDPTLDLMVEVSD